MAFVLDASVACAWVFADETTTALDDMLERAAQEEVFVPPLWRLEVLNVLIQASRRSRITEQQIRQYWSYLDRLGIRTTDYTPPVDRVIGLCHTHGLTAYDAHYLDLALWMRLPLATLDKQLAEAARAEGVTVLGGR